MSRKCFPSLPLFCLCVLLSACSGTAAPDIPSAETSSAQTIAALLTQVGVPSAALSPTAPSATATITLTPTPEWTLAPSDTLSPTATLKGHFTATRTITDLCNAAFFVGDVGPIFDGTEIKASTPFVKTWDVRNIGTCTWDPEYTLYLSNGVRLSGPEYFPLGISVKPNDHIFLSINLFAPPSPGEYTGEWKLMSSDGKKFGFGTGGKFPLTVHIRVVP